jgi:hypothetical protein
VSAILTSVRYRPNRNFTEDLVAVIVVLFLWTQCMSQNIVPN